MTLGLAERTRQAGSAAFKLGKHEQAIALYTEALQAADTLSTDGELKTLLLCNRSLCYLKLGEPDAALADATAAQKVLPSQPKAYYRAAQALHALGRNADAREALNAVLSRSRNNKNSDAERMLGELEGLPARGPALARPAAGGDGGAYSKGGGASRKRPAREDRAQRLTVKEVNEALESRCAKVKAIHKPLDQLRLHHELGHKPDLVVLTNFDWSLLAEGIITSVNNLKNEELLRPATTVLPAAARVWAMAVQVRAARRAGRALGSRSNPIDAELGPRCVGASTHTTTPCGTTTVCVSDGPHLRAADLMDYHLDVRPLHLRVTGAAKHGRTNRLVANGEPLLVAHTSESPARRAALPSHCASTYKPDRRFQLRLPPIITRHQA